MNMEKITIEECMDNAKKYYMLESSGKMKESRDAQMSQQMLACIRNSINDDCALKDKKVEGNLKLSSRVLTGQLLRMDLCS